MALLVVGHDPVGHYGGVRLPQVLDEDLLHAIPEQAAFDVEALELFALVLVENAIGEHASEHRTEAGFGFGLAIRHGSRLSGSARGPQGSRSVPGSTQ